MSGLIARKHLGRNVPRDPIVVDLWGKLYSWWPLVETSGTRFDYHRNNDLNVIGNESSFGLVTDGPGAGGGILFSNPTNFIQRAGIDCIGLDDQDTYEIVTWVKCGDIPGALWTIVSKGEIDLVYPTRGYAFHIGRDNDSPNKAKHMKGRNVSDPVDQPIPNNVWIMFSVFRNGTARGVARNAGVGVVTETSSVTSNSTSDPFRIGPRNSFDLTNDTYVGQTAFFSDVLTTAQREYLYNSGAGRAYDAFQGDAI